MRDRLRVACTVLLAALVLAASAGAVGATPREPMPPPEDVAGPPEGAEVTDSGLAWRVLIEGTGSEHPGPYDVVEVHYTGWTTDGEMFDSTATRGEPLGLPLDKVIAGWREGVQLMVGGEKRRFWIPEDLAYGGSPGKPSGMLVFDIELLRFDKRPAPPEDVAGPAGSFEMTVSGIAHRLLRRGTGETHPKKRSKVTVNYSGWTTDGRLFDSTVTRGKPATFRLDQVIKGWTEGVQLMVEGEKRRFWIPEKLAYRGQPGYPAGMLVFDIELLEIAGK